MDSNVHRMEPRAERGEKSLPDLMRDLVGQVATMLRHELELARAEMGEKAGQAGSGATMLGVALAIGIASLVILMISAVVALEAVVDLWLSALIVGGVGALIALILAAKGKSNLKARNLVPSRTLETMRDDARYAKEKVT